MTDVTPKELLEDAIRAYEQGLKDKARARAQGAAYDIFKEIENED